MSNGLSFVPRPLLYLVTFQLLILTCYLYRLTLSFLKEIAHLLDLALARGSVNAHCKRSFLHR